MLFGVRYLFVGHLEIQQEQSFFFFERYPMGLNGPGRYDVIRYSLVGICLFVVLKSSGLRFGQFVGLLFVVCSCKIVGRR